jgi:energy-coupling factor transporter ATP-binding protein EcfA2
MLRRFSIGRLPPFGDLNWDVPPVALEAKELAEVHLLVGPNGTGKSLMLATLAACLGAPGTLQTRIEGSSTSAQLQWFGPAERSPLMEVSKDNATRPPRELTELPAVAFGGTAFLRSASAIQHGQRIALDREGALAFRKPDAHSSAVLNAIHRLKVEAALRRQSLPVNGGQPVTAGLLIDRIERAIQNVCGFGKASDFHFHVTTYPTDEVRVHWEGKNLPINALADGLRSLVGWLTSALILLDQQAREAGHADITECESIILLDEIEAHLHPAWQRRVIPTFQRLLPKAQIFCATHSPFVISSLNHGWIHQFEKDEGGKIRITAVPASPGDSYDSVIEDIMGIKERFDPETESLLTKFRAQREAVLKGTGTERTPLLEALRTMASQIGARGIELQYMMGRELQQVDRVLGAGGGR